MERVREPGGVRHKALVIAYGCMRPAGGRWSASMSVRPRPRASGGASCGRCGLAGWTGSSWSSPTPTAASGRAIAKVLGCRWQRCTVHFLRDMLGHVARAQQPLVSGAIRGIFTAASAAEARERLGQVADQLRPHAPRLPGCWRTPRLTCWRSTGSRPSTGPSCAPPTRWSGSTARSAAARMWWGSSCVIAFLGLPEPRLRQAWCAVEGDPESSCRAPALTLLGPVPSAVHGRSGSVT